MKTKTINKETITHWRNVFSLDEETGRLYRKIGAVNAPIGSRCGGIGSDGYRYVRDGRSRYKEHRVVFGMVHGFVPPLIDHINQVKNDNRPTNLRETTHALNNYNRTQKNNACGVQGVGWEEGRNKWRAYICVDKKHSTIGRFDSFEAAVIARKECERAVCIT